MIKAPGSEEFSEANVDEWCANDDLEQNYTDANEELGSLVQYQVFDQDSKNPKISHLFAGSVFEIVFFKPT